MANTSIERREEIKRRVSQERERIVAEIGDIDKVVRETREKAAELRIPAETPSHIPKERLADYGRFFFNQFTTYSATIRKLLKFDLESNLQLQELFGGEKNKANIAMLRRIIANQQIILNEINAVVGYWDYVASNGKLPSWYNLGLSKFNNKRITFPFEKISIEERNLLAKITKLLKRESKVKA